ncbi:Helix-turn-helix domain-containing protein [Nitrosomonas aestuarii]|uniref:Helix-turn-helix domain-containing protein n=1 Tax=Nitrosomonas aestuarii TaxID=52441 RepID=A0A1I4B7C4_9PROT|nr:helix-turn-helix transcriptional regulator [Nitrosomonas aestuarii]SFK63819.1 Helix-turn-helix domain-containing protein [Nitrosomonas aestuarii]
MRKKPYSSVPTSAERVALARSIGKRLKESRENAGFTQVDAAKMLGYSNSSKLAKIEGATDTNSVPLVLILRAARLYEVSIDFIFGETEDWELGAQSMIERDVSKWVFDATETMYSQQMNVLKSLMDRTNIIHMSVLDMHDAATELEAAVRRFAELNPSFEDDMRGGSRLVSAVRRVLHSSQEGKVRVNRFNGECKRRFESIPQLQLIMETE